MTTCVYKDGVLYTDTRAIVTAGHYLTVVDNEVKIAIVKNSDGDPVVAYATTGDKLLGKPKELFESMLLEYHKDINELSGAIKDLKPIYIREDLRAIVMYADKVINIAKEIALIDSGRLLCIGSGSMLAMIAIDVHKVPDDKIIDFVSKYDHATSNHCIVFRQSQLKELV